MALDRPGIELPIGGGLYRDGGALGITTECKNLRPIRSDIDGRPYLTTCESLFPVLSGEAANIGSLGLVRYKERVYAFGGGIYEIRDDSTSISSNFSATQISTEGGLRSQAAGLNHVVSAGLGQAWAIDCSTNAVTRIDTQPNFLPNVVGVEHINGFFVFWTSDNKIFHSDINDPFSYRALDATTIQQTDQIQAVIEFRGELLVFFPNNMIRYGFIGGANFVFQARPNTRIALGLYSAQTVTRFGDTIYFVGSRETQTPAVYAFSGGAPKRISNRYIEQTFSNPKYLDRENISGSQCLTYSFESNDTLVVGGLFDQETFFYDLRQGVWFERSSSSLGTLNQTSGIQHIAAIESYIIASTPQGIHEMYNAVPYTGVRDFGEPVQCAMSVPAIDNKGKAIRVNSIMADFVADGVATVTLSYSDDHGRTYTVLDPVLLDAGGVNQKIEWNRLGSTDYDRIIRLEIETRNHIVLKSLLAFAS